MDITTIIILVLYVVGAVLAFKLLKSFAKAMFIVSIVGTILAGALVYYVYQDVNDFKENWPDSDKLLLLSIKGTVVSGVQTKLNDETGPIMLNQEEIDSINNFYSVEDMDSVLEENYKIFIIRLIPLIEKIESEEIYFGKNKISKDQAVSILESDNSFDQVATIIAEEEGIDLEIMKTQLKEEVGGDSEIKAFIFTLLINKIVEEQGSIFIFNGYKEGSIIIYPETAIFKMIKIVPQSVLNKVGGIVAGE